MFAFIPGFKSEVFPLTHIRFRRAAQMMKRKKIMFIVAVILAALLVLTIAAGFFFATSSMSIRRQTLDEAIKWQGRSLRPVVVRSLGED